MSPRAPSGSSHPPNNSGCVALNPHPADEAQRLRDFPGLTPKRVLPPPPHGVSEGPEEAGRERDWRPGGGGAPLPHQPRLLALGQALCPELPAPLRQSACGPQSEGPQRCPHPGSLEPVSALPHKAKGTAGSEPTQAPACLPGQASLWREAPGPCLAPRAVWGAGTGPLPLSLALGLGGDLSAEEQQILPQAPLSPALQRVILGPSVGAGLGSETPASLGLPPGHA